KININVPGSPYLGVNFGTSDKLTVDGFDVEQTGANAYAFTVGAGGAVRFQNNRFTTCFQALRVVEAVPLRQFSLSIMNSTAAHTGSITIRNMWSVTG